MTIKDDILALKQKQIDLYKTENRYIQMLPTPSTMPVKDAPDTKAWESKTGLKPSDESVSIAFEPAKKDYQFQVNVWELKSVAETKQGFNIIAQRDLGDGVIETVMLVDAEAM